MTPIETKKIVDRQGRLCAEEHLLEGRRHGRRMAWHSNGKPYFEGYYNHGVPLWGRYCDAQGQEITRYDLHDGTGVEIEWMTPSQGSGEVPWWKGKRHGIGCSREPDGRVRAYYFWVDDRLVDRDTYLNASAIDPSLPEWVPPDAERELAALVQSILSKKDTHEAARWLEESDERTLGTDSCHAESMSMIAEVYHAGARGVYVFEVDEGGQNASRLLVELPGESEARASVLEWCNAWATKGGFDAEGDVGQGHTIVVLG